MLRGFPNQFRAFDQLALHRLSRAVLLRHLFAPRREAIDPRLHGVLIAPECLDAEAGGPSIVAEALDGHFVPVVVVGERTAFERRFSDAIADDAGETIVSVREDVRPDAHLLPDGALHREPPLVHRRLHRLDDDARRPFIGRGPAHGSGPRRPRPARALPQV